MVVSAQAFLARSKRDNARTIERSEKALAIVPDADIVTRGIVIMNLGLAYWHEGYMAEAEAALMQACDLCQRSGNLFALQTAQIFLARIPAVQGKLHQAAALCQKLIESGGREFVHCHPHYDLAALHLEWNDLPKAWEYFENGFRLAQQGGNVELRQAGFLLRAILAHAGGDDEAALAALTEADEMARNFPAVIRSRTAAFGVQMALVRNDPQMLVNWEAKVKADVDSQSFYRFMGLTLPRLLMARGRKEEAAEILKAIHEKASQSGWEYGAIVVRILQCLAEKNLDEATNFLAEALRMGKPENYIRSFVDAGPGLIPVLQEVARRGIETEYAGRILAALGAGPGGEVRAQAGLIESLSAREIEVLQLVTEGLSNREIAGKLYISPGTAKTHIHNLCGKLGVRNRTEAAMRAKEFHLA
jgi:LuxR family maltose regulon positive regulatory protein